MLKRIALTATLLLAMAAAGKAQIMVDNRPAAYDSLTNTFLATVAPEVYGTDYTAQLSLSDGWSALTVGGVAVTDEPVTFSQVNKDAVYDVALQNSDGTTLQATLSFTTLPLVQLEGPFGSDYTDGYVMVDDPAYATVDTLTALVKWRGGMTNGPSRHKHNFKIKFPEDYRFFGLRNDNNWLLDAGQADIFRMRNIVAQELWSDFATPPYYADEEPKARSGIRGQMVEVFINHEYQGIYALTENVDRKQLKLKKFEKETGTIHGCLWKGKKWSYATCFGGYSEPYDNTKEQWDGFEINYPDLGDLDSVHWATLYDAINFTVLTSDEEFLNGYEDYFDMPVCIDYFVYQNVLSAVDNNAKNLIWAVYDKETDRRLTISPWDLDATVGQPWVEKYGKQMESPEYEVDYFTFFIERLLYNMHRQDAWQRIIDRYWELRPNVFSLESLQQRYQKYCNMVTSCNADKREAARWNGDTDIEGLDVDIEGQTAFICDWLEKRLAFLDNFYEDISLTLGIATQDGALTATRTKADQPVFTLTGQLAARPSQPGLYVSRGRKYLVRIK